MLCEKYITVCMKKENKSIFAAVKRIGDVCFSERIAPVYLPENQESDRKPHGFSSDQVSRKNDIMRGRTYVLIVFAACLLMSSGTKKAKPSEGVNPGDVAPGIELFRDDLPIQLQNHAGRYTLLNFWAAYDAESRQRNVRLANEVKKKGSDKIALYSFSLDEKASIFAETVRVDGLDEMTQFHEEQGKRSKLYQRFHRHGGLKNFLINDQGVIVATNVTPEKLVTFL